MNKSSFLVLLLTVISQTMLAGPGCLQLPCAGQVGVHCPAAVPPDLSRVSADLSAASPGPGDYLDSVKAELKKEWPHNRTINLVFHGHSVPSGYFRTPEVRTFDSYPYLVLKELKSLYPGAVINVIVTAIGGENSLQGAKRFREDVLPHRPDVLFIDYALNDRRAGLEKAREAWEEMLAEALKNNIKVILLTPSPDQRVDIREAGNELAGFSNMIRELAGKYHTGLADSYKQFRQLALAGEDLGEFMSQVNHPNKKGHEVIAAEIMAYFK